MSSINDGRSGAPTGVGVAIGFGSPSQDSGVTRLDLNDVLIRHPQASFLMRAAGEGMSGLGIEPEDLLLIDRGITPSVGHVVVVVQADEFVCRRLAHSGRGAFLQSVTRQGTTDHAGDLEFSVWGVVTHVIKAMPI